VTTLAMAGRDSRVDTLTTFSAVVGFYFAFRLVSVVIAVRLLDADPQLGIAASLALNYLILLAAGLLSFGPGLRTWSWFYSVGSFRWALAFLALSGSSLLWTASVSTSAAAAFWLAMASDFTVVLLLLRIGCVEQTAAALMHGYVWGACAIGVIAWLLPAQSDLRLGDEDYLGPNQFGYCCAFALFLAQYLMRKGNKGLMAPALFLGVTVLRSLSKTTIVALVAGQLVLLIRDRSLSTKTKLYLVSAAVLILTLFWGLLAAYYDVYTNAGNQSETLTGRIGIWAYILNEALEQPWIGHGFHSVWKVIPPFGPFEARHAHNELLQQFYAYGVVGLGLLAMLYGNVYREIRRARVEPFQPILLAMFVFVLVRGLADTEAFDLSLPLWAIVLIGSVLANRGTASEALESGVRPSYLKAPIDRPEVQAQ
jgi:exopolysaccharide production protein ExoQ